MNRLSYETQGMDAFQCGQSLDNNPFTFDSRESIEWELGWLSAAALCDKADPFAGIDDIF